MFGHSASLGLVVLGLVAFATGLMFVAADAARRPVSKREIAQVCPAAIPFLPFRGVRFPTGFL